MPQLDKRTREDLRNQARALADPTAPGGYTPGWLGLGHPDDLGWRLLDDGFLGLMELLIERFNRVPDAHFMRFLDFAGVERRVGGAAVVPVTFQLAKQAAQGGDIPARTQVATTQTERSPALVFETQRPFFATPARLLDVVNLIGVADAFSRRKPVDLPPKEGDLTKAATVVLSPSASGLERLPHELYLGGEKWFGRKEPTTITVIFTIPSGTTSVFDDTHLLWERYDDRAKRWTSNEVSVSYSVPTPGQTVVELTAFPGSSTTEVDGIKDHWIRCRYIGSPADLAMVPPVTKIEAALGGTTQSTVPDAAFANATPIDLARPFRPFGERPRNGDAFYISSARAFDPAVEQVTIQSGLAPYSTADLQRIFAFIDTAETITTSVRWEYLSVGGTWLPLLSPDTRTTTLTATPSGTPSQPTISFVPSPAQAGTFYLPTDAIDATIPANSRFTPGVVNRIAGSWVRALLVSNDPYGRDGRLITGTPPRFVGPFFVPPVVKDGVMIFFTHRATPEEVTLVRAIDNFEVRAVATPLQPFAAVPDFLGDDPAIYLAFDQPFGLGFISLFVHLDDVVSAPLSPREGGTPRVVWEYTATGGRWSPLHVEDRTADLTASGTVGFLSPADQSSQPLLPLLSARDPKARWWIRARLASGRYDHPPKLLGVYVNSVFAENRVSEDELVVGSSTGAAGQRLSLVRTPVLAGEVWVGEVERPTEEELQRHREETARVLEREIEIIDPRRPEWVRWLRVPNFNLSGPRSRHYTLDPVAGVLTFGGVGGRGLIPPPGRENIVIRGFTTGGGERASEDAGPLTVKQLTSSLPFVDKVWNAARAGGGSSPWSLDDTRRLGPLTIKNRGRAVTTEDYESLVLERFSGVARFRCLPTTAPSLGGGLTFMPGAVTGIVVPRSGVPMPQPGAALVRATREYLQTVALGSISEDIHVLGPDYTPVAVHAVLRPENPGEASTVARRATRALEEFFHPLSGGEHGQGWEFGRDVFLSEVYAVLERTPGVDVVTVASFVGSPPFVTSIAITEHSLVASGSHDIVIA